MKIHPLADVQTTHIGEGTTIWQFAVVLRGAVIGRDCNINCHTFIENDVIIGDNVTIKSGTYIWDATRIGDNVFLGPNVVLTNDLRPRSKARVDFPLITIENGASIGANTTILAGVTIGAYAMTGIASVVTRDVPSHALVYGNPAKIKGWIDKQGRKMKQIEDNIWEDTEGVKFSVVNSVLKSFEPRSTK
jgi:acetyltransferase-like isoleucine patch superfamily enzyme